ncbi:MAG: hypothetical protein HZC28_03070 [Spirochaetes bacterium]|nr:hypothetical protein [Spirochaetota bacterium]
MRLIIRKSIFLLSAAAAFAGILSAADIDSGLAAWWSFNDGSGKGVYDSSGNSNHARMRGKENDWVTGRVGGAMKFNGVQVSADFAGPVLKTGSEDGAFTIAVWVKADVQDGRERMIVGKPGFHAGLLAHTEKGITTFGFTAWPKTGGSCTLLTPAITDVSEWHHLAAVFDARKVTLYLDGKAVQRGTFTGEFRDYPDAVSIGATGKNAFAFKGIIDEVRIYTRALAGEDIAALMLSDAVAAVAVVPGLEPVPSVTLEKNRPELSLPLFKGKPVIAHYMTQMSTVGSDKSYFMNPVYGTPDGPASNIGGAYTYRATFAEVLSNKTAEEAIEFDVRTAKRLGIDGFHFYYQSPDPDAYPSIGTRNNQIIRQFFKVLQDKKIDFKLTLCISHPNQKVEAKEKIRAAAQSISELLREFKDSPNWLRAPDGRIIFFTWATEGYSDGVFNYGDLFRKKDIEANVKALAEGYEAVRQMIGIPASFVYHVWDQDTMYKNARSKDIDFDSQYEKYIDAVLSYFPAVTGFVDYPANENTTKEWARWSDECKKRGRNYGQAVMTDYVKTYKKNGKLPNAPDFPALKLNETKMLYLVLPGAVPYRTLWQRAVDFDASFISYVTWNDYPEGHHLAPEVNRNFAFAVLTEYYEKLWRKLDARPTEDVVMVFYHKYPVNAEPVIFPMKAEVVSWHLGREPLDIKLLDIIDVAAILKTPGEIWVNGKKRLAANAGFTNVQIPMEIGQVKVEIRRNGAVVKTLTPPEWITDKPYRTDRLIYSYSTKCDAMYREIFGDLKVPVADEYAEDAAGVPNWRKRYKIPETSVLDIQERALPLSRWNGSFSGMQPVLVRNDKSFIQTLSSAGDTWVNANDLSGRLFLANDDTTLYVGVEVTDDVHVDPPDDPAMIWKADSVQLGIAARDGSKALECGAAIKGDNVLFNIWKTPVADADSRIKRTAVKDGMIVRYTFKVPLDLFGARPGDRIAVSALANDADKTERKVFLEFGSGIGITKDTEAYPRYQLSR